jgi:signal transduction histidine kinase
MTQRAAKILAISILVAVILALGALFTVDVTGGERLSHPPIVEIGDPDTPGFAQVRADLQDQLARGNEVHTSQSVIDAIIAILAVGWGVTGWLIVSRQPHNRAGWLFCIGAATVAVAGFASAYTIYGVRLASSPLPGQDQVALVGDNSLVVAALIPLLVLLFPDGHPPTPRWRWAVWILLAGIGIAAISYALTPGPLNNFVSYGILYANPFGVGAFAEGRPANALVAIGALMIIGASLATVVAVWQRFRRARGEERQQLRWLVAVATVAGAGIGGIVALGPIIGLLGLDEGTAGNVLFASLSVPALLAIFVGIPAAYLIAIFKHGLWDLDVVIKKALVALVLTLVIVGAGLIAISVVGRSALLDGDRTDVVIGFVVGLAILPLALVGRRMAKRLVYGRRAAPYQVLSEFSERVGETYATQDVLPRMARILGEGTGATGARVWLRVGGELRTEAGWPVELPDRDVVSLRGEDLPEIDGETLVEVRDRIELLGALSVAMPASDPMNPSKERLIRDLAAQAGLVLRNVRLIQDLRSSRQRLVAAQDEERRKLERDLHDGAQQQLVALAVQLKLTRTMLERDPATLSGMLDSLQTSAADALADLRDLARGIYPQLLADRGLSAALEAQATKSSVPTTVRSDGVERYPREVEAAVYFTCLEALNNVAKYSGATAATVSLAQANGTLTFTVADDGVGFDPAQVEHGTGLQGMADRVDAIGGDVRVASAPGEGTTVKGSVPTHGAAT